MPLPSLPMINTILPKNADSKAKASATPPQPTPFRFFQVAAPHQANQLADAKQPSANLPTSAALNALQNFQR